jgi:hypothetical protein
MKRRPAKQLLKGAFAIVKTLGLALPDVEATTKYDGSPVLKVGGMFMAGLATHPSAEPDTLVVRARLEDRERLVEDALSMTTQTDNPNVRTIVHDSLGAEVAAYFGCWLDINQPTDLRFPARLIGTTAANLPDGPFQGTGPLLSIQQHVRSLHQCLIAEIDLDGQSIPSWADPSTSDKLAQRNLTFVGVPNPGVVNSRIAPQTLQIRPTPQQLLDGRPDELMIDWGNVPAGTRASVYLPSVDADAALDWAHRMYVSNRLRLAADPRR